MRINTHLGCLGNFAERYVPEGYQDKLDFRSQLEIISSVEGLDGLNISYPGVEDPGKLLEILSEYNIQVSDLTVDTWSDRKWKLGSISSGDKKIRDDAIKLIKEAMDVSIELGAHSVLVWPAHDGFDYTFQAHYLDAWNNMIDSLEEIGEHDPKVKVAIEYKQKDPRGKSYIENMGKLLLLIKSLNVGNIGVAFDTGHALFAEERLAESLMIIDKYQKLYQIHLNDNNRDADPDLVFGSINFWDTLEFFYWLRNIKYEGWLNVDVMSPRDNRKKTLELTIKLIKDYEKMADRLGSVSEEIDKNLRVHSFSENMLLIREILFGDK
ncbi:sugar phosphate isomerase/epimerase family protein [Actinomycetota bacterium]